MNAMGLGVWEAAAYLTHRVPTISATVHAARRDYPRVTAACVIGWCTGLSYYLLRSPR
jgi:hypothetical protein